MKAREFNKLLDKITNKKRLLDPKLIGNLTIEERKQMVQHIVRLRHPVVTFLIPDGDQELISWLNCCGYMYYYTNKAGFKFNGTCEHQIKYSAKQVA